MDNLIKFKPKAKPTDSTVGAKPSMALDDLWELMLDFTKDAESISHLKDYARYWGLDGHPEWAVGEDGKIMESHYHILDAIEYLPRIYRNGYNQYDNEDLRSHILVGVETINQHTLMEFVLKAQTECHMFGPHMLRDKYLKLLNVDATKHHLKEVTNIAHIPLILYADSVHNVFAHYCPEDRMAWNLTNSDSDSEILTKLGDLDVDEANMDALTELEYALVVLGLSEPSTLNQDVYFEGYLLDHAKSSKIITNLHVQVIQNTLEHYDISPRTIPALKEAFEKKDASKERTFTVVGEGIGAGHKVVTSGEETKLTIPLLPEEAVNSVAKVLDLHLNTEQLTLLGGGDKSVWNHAVTGWLDQVRDKFIHTVSKSGPNLHRDPNYFTRIAPPLDTEVVRIGGDLPIFATVMKPKPQETKLDVVEGLPRGMVPVIFTEGAWAVDQLKKLNEKIQDNKQVMVESLIPEVDSESKLLPVVIKEGSVDSPEGSVSYKIEFRSPYGEPAHMSLHDILTALVIKAEELFDPYRCQDDHWDDED